MFVTSAFEVLAPGIFDFIPSFLHTLESPRDLQWREAMALRYFDLWLKPELGLALLAPHMDMHSLLFSGKEKEPMNR